MTHPNEMPDPAPQDKPNGSPEPGMSHAGELENLSRQLAEAETNLAGMRDTLLRERAELENQRKRMQRDVEQRVRFANEKLLGELLPVCDGLEGGLGVQSATVASMREGLALTLKALLKVAADHGLEQLNPVGEPLDPERHHAVSMVVAPGHAPGTVVSVMQKGYLLNGRLLRPALVTVAKEP